MQIHASGFEQMHLQKKRKTKQKAKTPLEISDITTPLVQVMSKLVKHGLVNLGKVQVNK